MRTTLDLHHPLLTKAKAFAALNHMTLTRLIEDGMQLRMQQVAATRPATAKPMPTCTVGGGFALGNGGNSNTAKASKASKASKGAISGLTTRELMDAADAA